MLFLQIKKKSILQSCNGNTFAGLHSKLCDIQKVARAFLKLWIHCSSVKTCTMTSHKSLRYDSHMHLALQQFTVDIFAQVKVMKVSVAAEIEIRFLCIHLQKNRKHEYHMKRLMERQSFGSFIDIFKNCILKSLVPQM